MKAIVKTNLQLPGQTAHYVGKVRDVYSIEGDYLVMVVSDRISAFDVVLPKGIPFKGQVLNQIAAKSQVRAFQGGDGYPWLLVGTRLA